MLETPFSSRHDAWPAARSRLQRPARRARFACCRLPVTVLLALALARAAAAQHLQAADWVDLGYALAGSNGFPQLVATGSLEGGSALSVELSNAKELAHAYLVVGFSAVFLPYKGGILVPAGNVLVEMPTDATGAISLLVHWPENAPSGLPVVLQYWINDEAAIAGRSGSNAVGKLTP